MKIYKSNYKEQVRYEIGELRSRLNVLPENAKKTEYYMECEVHLKNAEEYLKSWWAWFITGSAQLNVWREIHFIKQILLLLEDEKRVCSEIISLSTKLVNIPSSQLSKEYKEERVKQLKKMLDSGTLERHILREIRRDIDGINDSFFHRILIWRSALLITGIILIAILIVISTIVMQNVKLIQDDGSKNLVWTVLAFGALGGGINSFFTIRALTPTKAPYGILMIQSLLKIPTGAAISLVGILFLQSALIHGLTPLEEPIQLAGWSFVFGFAERLFTHYLDSHISSILKNAEKPKKSESETTV